MAKKLTRKEKIALQQQEAKNNPAPVSKNPKQLKISSKLRRNLALLIAAFAFLLYANTLDHYYALDDYSLIKENTMTRKGTAALGEIMSSTYRSGYFNMDFQLYRPLSKVFFAIEWQLSPDNPSFGHWVNVLLYALTGFLLFYALSLYLKGNLLASFLAASLFIAHPIHTEVVANIKSLDEILCFLFFIVTTIFVHRYLSKNKTSDLVFALAAFFLSLLSKESAITFLAVIPLMVWFFMDIPSGKNITVTVSLFVVACLFLLIRMKVIGDVKSGEVSIVDNLLSGQDGQHRLATAIMIMGMYLKLFIFPHPLVSDYSFRQIPIVGFGDWHFLLSLLVYAALGVFALMRFKQKDPISFCILYFFITASVASNIFIMIGTSFGERLMYTPSFGFCFAVAILIDRFMKSSEEAGIASTLSAFFSKFSKPLTALGVVLALYSFKTFTRNPDWHDNLTLYREDVKNSPLSARTHYYLGNYISQDDFLATFGKDSTKIKPYLDEAITELTTATQIYPQFADAWQQLGKIYLGKKNFKKADEYYEKAISINPQNPLYLNNYGNVLFNIGRLDDAKKKFEEAIKWNPTYAHAYNNLASVYGAFGENARAQKNEAEAKKNFESSIFYFKKAIECDPEYSTPYYFLGITYRNIGDEQNAQFYINKSKTIGPQK